MRRPATLIVVGALVLGVLAPADAQANSAAVIFVHGMGGDASDIGATQFVDLLEGIARAYPAPGACQDDAQAGRSWDGSPCVFRFVEDAAETDAGPNDSQSAVQDNADKLAREVAEVFDNAGRRVLLVGYSMGGAIIRTYLATHHDAAAKQVSAVVLLDAVASGSWGYAFTAAVPRRFEGPLGAKLAEVMRSLAATTSAVDFDRPATRDLRPRSALYRRIAPMPLPSNISYYTFWGDIRISVERKLLVYDLPTFEMPPLGDLGLLPGDPDPTVLPELGGQRFSPKVDGENVALDIAHRTSIALETDVVKDLLTACGHKPTDDGRACKRLVATHFVVPNTHTALPASLSNIAVDEPALGGQTTLLDAALAAIARHA